MVDTNDTESPAERRKKRDRVADKARAVRDTATSSADNAVKATAEAVDQNPFGALAGAIAVGAVAAAMIPASRRELEALGPWTDKMRDAIVEAFDAAKAAGAVELTAGGLTLAAASEGVGGIVGKLVKAATVASSAAATSVNAPRASVPATTSESKTPLESIDAA